MKKTKVALYVPVYNQENYILESLQSAYEQDYDNLIIYIADDCSTDNSYYLAEEFVKNNKTKHEVVLKRNPKNLGPIENTLISLKELEKVADLVVLQAGDDISYPTRVSTLTELWISLGKPQYAYIHTPVEIIDHQSITKTVWTPPINHKPINESNLAVTPTSQGLAIGASAAYTPSLVLESPFLFPNLYADQVLVFRSFLKKNLIYWGETLIKYRFGVGISSPYVSRSEYEKRITLSTIDTLKQRRIDALLNRREQTAMLISNEILKWEKLAKFKGLID